MDLNEILAVLPTLSHGERQQIRKALDAINGHAPLQPVKRTERIVRPEWTMHEHEVINALDRFMKYKGAEMVIKTQLDTGTEFRDRVVALYEFINTVTQDHSEQRHMLMLGFDLIYNRMVATFSREGLHRLRTMTTAQALLSRIHWIPALINRQFPGYAAHGLLPWIFKHDAHGRPKHVRQESSNQTTPAGGRPTGRA